MSLKLTLAGLSLAALLGCATPHTPSAGPSPAPSGPSGGICNAQGAQFAIGKAPGASIVEQARQRSGAYMARVLRPNQAVTMEFNAQRLNLDVDAAGVITRARCG
ncbi:proteinase inhibitor I78 [Polaromonas sp. P1-6]|nr:proteinase inhibitor I78 [Polaromonas sp. P1-6]